jgi:hypothetical protein
MVRPNGSVIGRDNEAAEVNAGSVIQRALSLRQPRSSARAQGSATRNLGMMRSAYNPPCGAVQAISGWA